MRDVLYASLAGAGLGAVLAGIPIGVGKLLARIAEHYPEPPPH